MIIPSKLYWQSIAWLWANCDHHKTFGSLHTHHSSVINIHINICREWCYENFKSIFNECQRQFVLFCSLPKIPILAWQGKFIHVHVTEFNYINWKFSAKFIMDRRITHKNTLKTVYFILNVFGTRLELVIVCF